MATIDQLSQALANADKAGDTQAAKAFANEIIRLRSLQAGPDTTNTQSLADQVAQPGDFESRQRQLVQRAQQTGQNYVTADDLNGPPVTPVVANKRQPVEGFRAQLMQQHDPTLWAEAPQEQPKEATPAQIWAKTKADKIDKNMPTDMFSDMSRSAERGVPFADEILSAMMTPLQASTDWYKGEGFDIPRAFDRSYALDHEMQARRDARHPIASTVGGILGSAVPLGAASRLGFLAKASNTARAANAALPLKSMILPSAADGAIISSVYGAGEGDNLTDRAKNAIKSAILGAGIGAVTPPLVAGVTGAVKGIVRPVEALFRPEKYTQEALGAYLRRAGMAPDDVANALANAHADNQGMYTIADALGNTGRRALVPVTRTANDARQEVADQLTSRQMDQGRRVAADLTDASGTPQTAQQYQQALRDARSTEAARNYLPVEQDTTPINVSPAVDEANRRISPQAQYLAGVRGDVPTDLASRRPIEAAESQIRDPIREAVRQARSYLASDNLTVTNVDKAFRAKTNIDQMINDATKNGQGAQVNALTPVRDALDEALARTSQQYAAARDAYRTASQRVDAVDVGRQMERGRTRVPDNLATFAGLPDDEARAAARVGYFDPKIAAAESTKGTMTNAVRPFTSESMRQELPAFASPGQGDQLMRRIGREQNMFETTKEALGGSKTADNFGDMADMSQFDPEVMSRLFRGDFLGAAAQGAKVGLNVGKGLPPRVVERIGRALMTTDPAAALATLTPAQNGLMTKDALRHLLSNAIIGESPDWIRKQVWQ